MRQIIRIAKNELKYLFYSPIAWFALMVFFMLTAIAYCNPIYNMANTQEIMVKNSNPGWTFNPGASITGSIFGAVYKNALSYLYLFIPLLTMGLMSRERNESTIRLLFSSPVTTRQVVLGKYLGMVLYLLMLVAVVVLFMILGFFNIRNADYGLFFSGALGFYLLVCAYAALGLFMSTLSVHFVISAVGTFMIIFVLDRIGSLWQEYDFIRDLTWFLSLQQRAQTMVTGLIVTKDIVYYLVISFIFVCFTIIKMRSERESKPWYIKTGRYALVMILALMIGYITSRPVFTGYLDTTATKYNTIPKELQQLLAATGDSSLEVTLYVNVLSRNSIIKRGIPEARNKDYFAVFWDKYLRFKPDITFKYEYYYDIDPLTADSAWYQMFPGKSARAIAIKAAQRLDMEPDFFKSGDDMRKHSHLPNENNRMVMELKYKGRTEILRTLNDVETWPDYGGFSAAIKRLLEPDKISKVYFITGELERNIHIVGERGYSNYTAKQERTSVTNMGLDVDTLNLNFQNIPTDAAALILADPVIDLTARVHDKLRRYINAGGNMLILGRPGRQYVLNPMLKQLGIQLMNGQLVQPSYDETNEKVLSRGTPQLRSLAFETEIVSDPILTPNVGAIASETDSLFVNQVSLLTYPGMAWLKSGTLVIDSTLPPPDLAAGDLVQDHFVTAKQLTRKLNGREQRIFVSAGADFVSNLRLDKNNLFLIRGVLSWLTYNHFPIEIQIVNPDDILLKISERGARLQKVTFIWILPGLILLAGTIILIRRKRK